MAENSAESGATRKVVGDRIVVVCATCRCGTSYPNKGLGRAYAATWMSRHQHPTSPAPGGDS